MTLRTIPKLLIILSSLIVHFSSFGISLGKDACPRGSFIENGECKLCQPGTYSSEENSSSCTACIRGWYYPFRGGVSKKNCLECPAGTYADKFPTKTCKTCPSGTYSQKSATECLTCPPGSGLHEYFNRCETCTNNFYNDGSLKFCAQCPNGTFSSTPSGADKCLPCPKGTFSDMRYTTVIDRWVCPKCPRNTFANVEGTQQCPLCPLGTVLEPGAVSCEPCPAGTFRDSLRKRRCVKCPAGLSNKPGSAGCRHPDKGCPFDTFEDVLGACKACRPGERYDVLTKSCIHCAENEVSRGGAVTECTKCTGNTAPASDVALDERSTCVCKVGYARNNDGSCSPRPPGTYGHERQLGSKMFGNYRVKDRIPPRCYPCNRGSYSDKPGATINCKVCPVNSIAKERGATMCEKCPQGSVTAAWDSYTEDGSVINQRYECFSLRHNCAPGLVRLNDVECRSRGCSLPKRRLWNGGCGACDEDEYWNEGLKRCEPCPPGEKSAEYPHTETTCFKCTANATLILEGRKCVCNDGFGLTTDNKCEPCPKVQVVTNGKCVKCAQGVEQSAGGTSPSSCGLCRGNWYLPENATKCVKCPEGYKKARDVAGNKLNMCRPIDVYEK